MNVAAFPSNCSEGLAAALAFAGTELFYVDELDAAGVADAAVLVVELSDEPMRRLRHIEQIAEDVGLPIIVVLDSSSLPLVERAKGITDFILDPINPAELGVRLRRHLHSVAADEQWVFKDLELNTLTYQASINGRPLDLTYMEYELLRFLVENQGRVWSREQLLSKVWGYDYYGGGRTVDVHIRRVRAKLGEERSSWITTVRSVGYRFG